MNMKLTLIIAALVLSGCEAEAVDSWELLLAVKNCGGVENIDRMRGRVAGYGPDGSVLCNDGAMFKLDRKYIGKANER